MTTSKKKRKKNHSKSCVLISWWDGRGGTLTFPRLDTCNKNKEFELVVHWPEKALTTLCFRSCNELTEESAEQDVADNLRCNWKWILNTPQFQAEVNYWKLINPLFLLLCVVVGSLVAWLFEDMTKSPWEDIDKSIADWKAKWSEHLENWKLVKCLPVLELHEAVQDCGPKQGQLRKTVIKAALHPNKKQLSVLLQLALAIWKDGCKHWKLKKV